jgi:16S rRNA (cytosine967-C5)-methyltransferase
VSQNLVANIISAASRENPADRVLREKIKAQRWLLPADVREISLSVFSYFRWRGWLDLNSPLNQQIRKARELAGNFTDRPGAFSDADLASRVAPDWIHEEMEITPAWARAIQGEPKLWLRAKPGQGGMLCEKLDIAAERRTPIRRVSDHRHQRAESEFGAPVVDAIRYEGEEDLFRRPEFHAGEFEIQDIASQAVGWLCAPRPGETWWDACAGEGGKTLHLSALMENHGLIWASDRAEWRLKNLKRRAARAKVFNFRAASWDGGSKLPTKTKFDGVLVDAPCSGVGTWQRNPHARWTTTLPDVKELAAVQKRLLANVVGSVKPGGKLIYAVCTLTRAETTEVAADFSARFAAEFAPLILPEICRAFTSAATLTIWPQDLGGNGMFIAGWCRRV